MKIELAALVITLHLLVVVCGSWVPQENQNAEENADNIPRNYWFDDLQRRSSGGKWCGDWGDVCNPEGKSAASKCCGEMKCVCGILFKQGSCKCKQGSVFGR